MKYFMVTTPTDSRTLEVKKLVASGKIKEDITFIDFRSDEGLEALSKHSVGTLVDEKGNEVSIASLIN